MERHAHFALVGAISTLLLLAGIGFVIWLGQFQFNHQYDRYRIVFQGPVRGLSEGGEVQFSGIKIGVVQHIALDAADPNKVIMDIRANGGTPVRVDSVATTELQGISGIDVIQISAGTPSKPLLRDVDHSDRPIIRSKPSALSSLLMGGGQVLQSANETLDRLNRVLSDETIANLGLAVRDLRNTTDELAAHRALFGKLDNAATDMQGAAASVHQIASGDGRHAFADLAAAAADLKVTVHEAHGTVSRINGQSASAIPNINATMESLRDSATSLNGLVSDIRTDPRGTLGKPRGKELELPK
jgi:phospholipid/cholesterol/gamma-HCH transport system substrate-binding protein